MPGARPPDPPPVRLPVRVTADSARQFTGACEAVLVAHGLFLESVPYRPFLYVPIRSRVLTPTRRTITVTAPDGRAVTLEFTGPDGEQQADDTAAFLVGKRGLPEPPRPRSTVLPMVALVLGLMLLGGVGAVVYMATREPEVVQAPPSEPAPVPPTPTPPKTDPEPVEIVRPSRPPSAIDAAYDSGVHRFEDGPDDVTALAVTGDGSTLIVGYKNGTTRVWSFDQPSTDPYSPGPKSDGAPTRIQFDGTGTIAYLNCSGGLVAAAWVNPPEVPVKIPGDLVVPYTTASGGERFAALRGNTVTHRQMPTAMIQKPSAPKAKGFVVTIPKDEPLAETKANLAPPPQRPTVLAWHPTGRLLAGQPDGSIVSWGPVGAKVPVVSREHKAAVRAWAASPAAWDLATGDDKGTVGLWLNKSMTPKTFAAASAPITQLSFSPFGLRLAVADAEGNVTVWDLATLQPVAKLKRPAGTVIAYGPFEDLLVVSDGKAVELRSIPEPEAKE